MNRSTRLTTILGVIAGGLCVHFALVACEAALKSRGGGSTLPDASAAEPPCAQWEVRMDLMSSVVAGSSILVPTGWEPFGASGLTEGGYTELPVFSRRCVPAGPDGG